MHFLKKLQAIEEDIVPILRATRRLRAELSLLFVTKTLSSQQLASHLNALASSPQKTFYYPPCLGENRAQHLKEKARSPLLTPFNPQWHFIGRLQKNKIKDVLPFISLFHSLDNFDLALKMNQFLQNQQRFLKVLVQVNVSKEPTKAGVGVSECLSFLESLLPLSRLQIVGLMTMAPFTANPKETRPCFQQLAELKKQANAAGFLPRPLTQLSMGMSNDFRYALQEGATIIRLGTALFGNSPPSA